VNLVACSVYYFKKTPWFLRKLYPSRLWRIDSTEKNIYLTFDDGPHPELTPFILDQLRKYNAKATFFFIGDCVAKYPQLYQRVLAEGHAVGNHSQHHLDGFKTADAVYLEDVKQAAAHIHSGLFRPPYGRLRSSQARQLTGYKIVMWEILSGDFDPGLNREKCLDTVMRKTRAGSIIVFHESDKAKEKMTYCLPVVLEKFSEAGYRFTLITEKKDSVQA
jgi:peptidoglycan-N-acetylglucosamine deacetylase